MTRFLDGYDAAGLTVVVLPGAGDLAAALDAYPSTTTATAAAGAVLRGPTDDRRVPRCGATAAAPAPTSSPSPCARRQRRDGPAAGPGAHTGDLAALDHALATLRPRPHGGCREPFTPTRSRQPRRPTVSSTYGLARSAHRRRLADTNAARNAARTPAGVRSGALLAGLDDEGRRHRVAVVDAELVERLDAEVRPGERGQQLADGAVAVAVRRRSPAPSRRRRTGGPSPARTGRPA